MGRFVEEDIATFLESKVSYLRRSSTTGTAGTQNLYLGDLPIQPTLAAAVYEKPGDAPLVTFGGGQIARPRITVLTRGPRYVDARLWALDIYDQLNHVGPFDVAGSTYSWIEARSRPVEIAPDGENNNLFSCSYMIWKAT